MIPILVNLASVALGVIFAIGVQNSGIDIDTQIEIDLGLDTPYFVQVELPRLLSSLVLFANSWVKI